MLSVLGLYVLSLPTAYMHHSSSLPPPSALPMLSVLRLHVGLANLALTAYTHRLAYVESVYDSCVARLAPAGAVTNKRGVALLRELCMLPLDRHPNVLTALQLAAWPRLVGLLAHDEQKKVSHSSSFSLAPF
jgi:hypothetical protein